MKKPKAIQLYLTLSPQFGALSDAQAGRLIKAVMIYAETDEEPDFSDDQTLAVFFLGLKSMVERDFERYRRRCEANKRNAVLGGAPAGNQNAKKYADEPQPENAKKGDDSSFSAKTTETTQYKAQTQTQTQAQEKAQTQAQIQIQEKEKEKAQTQAHAPQSQEQSDLTAQTLSLFHQICHSISSDDSDRLISEEEVRTAMSAYGERSLEGLFKRAERSDFLSGRSGKWKGCTLRWLLEPENILRILRGAYDNKKQPLAFDHDARSPALYHKPLFDD